MRKVLFSLVAGVLTLGGLALAPTSAQAAHGHWEHHSRHVRAHRNHHSSYYYWYYHGHRLPRHGC